MGRAWVKSRRKDPYYRRAKSQGYRSRAAFKLIQADARFNLIYEGDTVVDLGAAPGGWSQVARFLVGDKGRVIAVDRIRIRPLAGVDSWRGDLADAGFVDALAADVGKVDVVLCDIAPRLSGNKTLDHGRSIGLARIALDVARRLLHPGGNFLCKVFQGEDFEPFLRDAAKHFEACRAHAPEASRKDSREMYVVAKGFKG